MKHLIKLALLLLGIVITSCNENKKELCGSDVATEIAAEVQFQAFLNKSDFDTIIDGKSTHLYWLKNKK